ncbi:hypothetical protein JTB14_010376 [Gonioctena quinquepunctata]|nr:hypothetical protein JTB14_010376 [Gonioctena quinquepunctata]
MSVVTGKIWVQLYEAEYSVWFSLQLGDVSELEAAGDLYTISIEVYQRGILRGLFSGEGCSTERLFFSGKQLLNDIIPNYKSSTNPPQQTQVDFGNCANTTSTFFDSPQGQQQPLPDIFDSNPLQVTSQQPPLNIPQALPELSGLQPHLNNPSQQSSHLSSVFSSFSNILNFGNSNNSNKDIVVPPPACIETLISEDNRNPEPVPLFPANEPRICICPPKPPTTTGPVNAFRRGGLKRPTYAPIPGLSGNNQLPSQNIPPQNLPPIQNLPPLPITTLESPIASYFSIQNTSVSPANSVSSASSIEPFTQTLPNHFKPISPPPPSVQSTNPIPQPFHPVPQPLQHPISQPLHNISQPFQPTSVPLHYITPSLPTVPTYPVNFGQPLQTSSGISKSFNSPVMDAIPVSEVLQNSNLNNAHAASNKVSTNENVANVTHPIDRVYKPVKHHWFFQKESGNEKSWQPFSMMDSLALEEAFTSNDLDPDKVIATDGGRYDVNILRRQRTPVYWKGNPTEVQRCSWFHRVLDSMVPYEENIATMLEEEYKSAFEKKQWHKKVELANGESIMFHEPDVMVLFPRSPTPDAWGNTPTQQRPRTVKRGIDGFNVDEGESAEVDHILFMVHGIGSVCDLKLRTVEEVVDEFRNIALQLVQSHYRSSTVAGNVHRVEVLPISWHDKLHSEETGIDNQLKGITLESIPKLRSFTNETLLDILFYTSPVYCQNIVATVGNELNRVYDLFNQRNPSFTGGVSLSGHSLGSLILFDLLCHQDSKPEPEEQDDDVFPPKSESKPPPTKRKISRRISYMMGTVGTGQPQIHYPHLNFEPKTFFALGSPIGMFVIVRGLDTLGENFALPTCPAFFNIFHPFDPIAYRIESLIHPDMGKLKPVLIPHHKGRKRMHLELKDTMARVGADLKQKVIDSVKSTWNSLNQFGIFHRADQRSLEEEVQVAIMEQLENKVEAEEEPVPEETNCPLGSLNKGRRVDYILQEAPIELINEYIFALASHVCYWESEDTILLMLKEIYSSVGITSDSQIPQQSMTIERPPPSPTSLRSTKLNSIFQKNAAIGSDPTAPMQEKCNLLPPPTSGFIRKT